MRLGNNMRKSNFDANKDRNMKIFVQDNKKIVVILNECENTFCEKDFIKNCFIGGVPK